MFNHPNNDLYYIQVEHGGGPKMKKLLAAGMIMLFLALYFIVGTGYAGV